MTKTAPERWASPAVVAIVSVVYLATTARHALGGDSAEFAAIVTRGGVLHPSGYPLYALWLRAFAWIPAAPAHAASIATALLGIAAAWLVIWAARRWGATATTAALSGLCFALSPIAWKLATSPEAFALNAALSALIVGLAAPGAPPSGKWRVAALGLAAGLSLSNHLTATLLAPLGVWALVRAFRSERAGFTAVPLGVGAFLLGLLPYLSLLVGRRDGLDTWAWGETSTLAGLWRHAIRADFGSLQHSVAGVRDTPGQLGLLAETLLASNGLVWAAGLAGLPTVWRERASARSALVCLIASALLCGPGFAGFSNISMSELTPLVMGRFHEMPIALLAIVCPLGLDAWRRRLADLAPGVWIAVGASAAVSAAVGWSSVRQHHRPTVELWTRSVLAHVPPRSVVMGTGDARVFPFAYAQFALGLRPDVVYVDPWLMHHRWYRAALSRRLGFEVDPPIGKSIDTIAFAKKTLAHDRPLFITNHFTTSFPIKLSLHPSGPILRVELPATPAPPLDEIERGMSDSERDLEAEPVEADSWGADPTEWRARGWLWLADAYGERGDTAGRLRAYERAKALAPWVLPSAR